MGHNACGKKATLNSSQLKTVLKLAVETLHLTQRQSPEAVANIWRADSWASLKQELVGCKIFGDAKGLHQICDQVVKAVPRQETKVKKRKIIEGQSASDRLAVKRKKVKT